jgi:uncharacterized membrane protein SirB2
MAVTISGRDQKSLDMLIIKIIHVSCGTLSITGFLGRSILKFSNPQRLQQRWLKITPHLIDSILLASGIVLVMQTRQYPFVVGWVTTKLLVLVLYIGFGLVTLRFARTPKQLALGFVGACLSFSYIIAVAVTQQVWLFT